MFQVRRKILVALLCIVSVHSANAANEWTWHATEDKAHPDQSEQHLMWLMNRARQNPGKEGNWLASVDHSDIAEPRSQYRVSLRKLRKQFRKLSATPPAAFDVRLYYAARKHSLRMISKDAQSHRGQMRHIKRSGLAWQQCRGSVFAFATSSLNAHAAFNIDWGNSRGGVQRGIGHRKALMSVGATLSLAGIAVVPETSARTRVGPLVVTANYCSPRLDAGTAPTPQLVGTVYEDLNDNNAFDPGEGISGAHVSTDIGKWYAITAAGGGYALPLPRESTVRVTVRTPGHVDLVAQLHSGHKNLLQDFVLGASSYQQDATSEGRQ